MIKNISCQEDDLVFIGDYAVISNVVLLVMKTGRKPLKKRIQKKIVNLAIKGKTDAQILSIIPTISQSSVSKVKKSNQELIERSKKNYIKLIDKLIGDKKQAEVLKGVINAKQDIFNFKGQVVGNRPDYKIRLEAIKYIDKLKGREQLAIKQTQNNMFIGQKLDKYLS
jgi:hypothetical protein